MANKLKIIMLLDGEFLDDIRVKKEAFSLKNSFEIAVITSNPNNRRLHENYRGIEIIRIQKLNNKKVKFLYDTWVAVNRVHPLFYKTAADYLKKQGDVIFHIHDLPLAGTGIKLKKNFSNVRSLIIDFHENYPEGLQGWNKKRKNLIINFRNNLFFGLKRWTRYEAYAILNSDKIIVVIDEMKDYLIKKHNIPAEKIFIVPNSIDSDFGKDLRNKNLAAPKEKEFNILYIGGIGIHRGIDTLIEGIAKAKINIPHLKLLIYGKGNKDVLAYLKSLVSKFDLKDAVEFNDWVPITDIPELLKKAHINVIPHKSDEHTNHTMPNKIYQMLLVGQPILVSTCKPIKRIVEETDSGNIFIAENADSCAQEILKLYDDYEYRIKNKNKVIALAEKHYSWENSSKEFIEFYQRLVQ